MRFLWLSSQARERLWGQVTDEFGELGILWFSVQHEASKFVPHLRV